MCVIIWNGRVSILIVTLPIEVAGWEGLYTERSILVDITFAFVQVAPNRLKSTQGISFTLLYNTVVPDFYY